MPDQKKTQVKFSYILLMCITQIIIKHGNKQNLARNNMNVNMNINNQKT